eukprot:126984_1
MGNPLSQQRALRFDCSNGEKFSLSQWGEITHCKKLPGPQTYQLHQCVVVINKVAWSKLRFFVYDERYDELIKVYEAVRNVQRIYDQIVTLLSDTQPDDIYAALQNLMPGQWDNKPISRSYILQNPRKNFATITDAQLLHKGDLIARPMNKLAFWHYGIYFDSNHVYHWVSPNKQKNNKKNKGKFACTTFNQFINNKTKLYVEYDVVSRHSHAKKMTEAQRVLQHNPEYDLFSQNCEHLARYIFYGKRESKQVQFGSSHYGNKCLKCKSWSYVKGVSIYKQKCDLERACQNCKKVWRELQDNIAAEARLKANQNQMIMMREADRQWAFNNNNNSYNSGSTWNNMNMIPNNSYTSYGGSSW